MGAPWVGTPSWEIVARVSDVIGRDVARLLVDADDAMIRETRNAQIATFALSLVALDRVGRAGLRADAVAGHSLGEYTALVAAGALDVDAGAVLVGARGDAMQAASEARPGTMAAVIGLEPDAVASVCDDAGDGAWLANDNAPGQVVIAGTQAGVDAAGELAKSRGASRIMPLAVGGAFHSPLMASAQGPLDAALAAAPFGDARLPVFANVDAEAHRRADEWPALLSKQLCAPVQWRRTLLALHDAGATAFVELGPGDALTGMVKRTVASAERRAAATPEQADGVADLVS
jgi:[acyl-carrier-protein] S-malonyltransferase